MNMKRTANKFQRAYMVAKARVQEVESQQEAIEKKFIADKGIVNPDGSVPEFLYCMEDDAAFEELCDFLREVRIERAGVFPFSPEEGTKAALMEHVDMEEAQRRAELAVDVQSDIIDAYNDSILGEEREVLCEGYDSQAQMFYGRSYAESPDIDGRIWFTTDSEIAPGSFVNVRLTGTMDGETTGELV